MTEINIDVLRRRTYLGKAEAPGIVVSSYSNNGKDDTEGAFYRNAIATYSHGRFEDLPQ